MATFFDQAVYTLVKWSQSLPSRCWLQFCWFSCWCQFQVTGEPPKNEPEFPQLIIVWVWVVPGPEMKAEGHKHGRTHSPFTNIISCAATIIYRPNKTTSTTDSNYEQRVLTCFLLSVIKWCKTASSASVSFILFIFLIQPSKQSTFDTHDTPVRMSFSKSLCFKLMFCFTHSSLNKYWTNNKHNIYCIPVKRHYTKTNADSGINVHYWHMHWYYQQNRRSLGKRTSTLLTFRADDITDDIWQLTGSGIGLRVGMIYEHM